MFALKGVRAVQPGKRSVYYSLIARAAAQVSRKLVAHFFFADRLPCELLAQFDQGHQNARRAIAALQPKMLGQCSLKRIKRAVGRGQPLNRAYLRTRCLHCQHQARTYGGSIDQNGASPAHSVLAADMCSREIQLMTQKICQIEPWLNLGPVDFAVDGDNDIEMVNHGDRAPKPWISRSVSRVS
ncbi:protein of unknown function [Hyphomicrobium sp. MC1]|nr:protein of unknown function [Hyphomicrobium sp. MC1]